jgi:hypothetical protein
MPVTHSIFFLMLHTTAVNNIVSDSLYKKPHLFDTFSNSPVLSNVRTGRNNINDNAQVDSKG